MSSATHSHAHHVSSPALLISTFVALVALTALTVALAQLHLGAYDMVVTLAIATVKALLVAVIFMHLQHDKLFNSLLLVGATVFLVLFVGMVLLDSDQYQPQIKSYLDKNAAAAATP